jgi:hypothetical protein
MGHELFTHGQSTHTSTHNGGSGGTWACARGNPLDNERSHIPQMATEIIQQLLRFILITC